MFEEFLYIINDRYSEVMCAKCGRSRMNDAHAQYVWPTLSASLQKLYG